jgi:hypothetical protein
VTQEQLDALLAQIGGGRLSHAPAVETKKVPNPDRLNPDGTTNYLKPKEIEVTIQRWHDPASGRVVEAYQTGTGWTVARNTTDKNLVNVGAPSASATPPVRTINGVPHERTIGDDGEPVWTPVQTATGPAGAATADSPTTQEAARIRDERWWNQNTPPNPADPKRGGSGRAETHTERIEREEKERTKPATKQDAVPGYPGWTYRTDKDANGNELTVYFPPGSNTPQRSLPEKPAAPDKPQQSITTITGGDGQPYTRVVTMGPNGVPVIKTYGPGNTEVTTIPGESAEPKYTQTRGDDGQVYTTITTIGPDKKVTVQTVDQRGNPVEKIPTKAEKPETREIDGELHERGADGKWRPVQIEGRTGAGAGPPLPRVVVGMSVGALTDYKDQLAQEVASGRQTQAWANARWGEAKDLATYAVQESTLLQNEYATNLSASVNLAQSKLSHLDSGMKSALQFVLAINDKLPPNSPLGGKAFAALLGLNSINMARSGINDIKVGPVDTRGIVERGRASAGGGGTVPPPRPRVANPANGEAIEAQRQQAIADLRRETGVSNTTDAGGAPRESTPAVQVGPGHATPSWERGVAPAPPATAETRPPMEAPAPPNAIGAGVVPSSITPPPPPLPDTGQTPSVTPLGMPEAPAGPDLAVLANYRPQQQEAAMQTPPPAPPPLAMPEQPQIQIPQQQPLQVDPATGAEPLALMRERILSTPPWRMDNSMIEWARANGLEDEIWKTPTMGLAV